MSDYVPTTVSVTSASTPVVLMAPGNKASYMLRVRSNAAVTVYVWPYSGTTPVAAPSQSGAGNGVMELAAGQFVSDEDPMNSYASSAMQQGWAAVLSTGVTAVTVDVIYRG